MRHITPALCLIGLASAASAAAPSPRLQTLLEAPGTSHKEIVRALLAEPDPAEETRAFLYMKPPGDAPAFYAELDEERVMAHPWQRPDWFVAFRHRVRKFGQEGGPRADIEMAAPPGEAIAVGEYTNAQAFAFQDEGRPGLTLHGPCEGEGGKFELIELNRNAVNHIDRLGATFESEGCKGMVVYRRGPDDRTGLVDHPTPVQPRPVEPLPSLDEVVAGFAAKHPPLAEIEIPENPEVPTLVFYGHGDDYVAKGQHNLIVGKGPELKLNMKWEPKLRVFDLRYDSRDPATDKRVIWDFQMSCGVQEELATGIYPWAGRLPFQAIGFPGINIVRPVGGCNTIAGYFRVLELKRKPDGTFERFAADFVQHCEAWGPAMRGFLVYRAP